MVQFGDVIAPSLGCVLSVVRHFIAVRDILAVRKSGQIGVRLRCTSGAAYAMWGICLSGSRNDLC